MELDGDELNAVLEAEEEAHLERIEPVTIEAEPAEPAVVSGSPDMAALLRMAADSSFERVTDHDLPSNEPKMLETVAEVMEFKIPDPAPLEEAVSDGQLPAVADGAEPEVKPARKRSRKKAEPVIEKVEEPVKKKSTRSRKKVAEPEPLAEPASFERVMDDDAMSEAGDLLKEAIVQRKIIEQTRADEYQTQPDLESVKSVEPEPEVRVGSLREQLSSLSAFERVEDHVEAVTEEEAVETAGTEPAEDAEAGLQVRPQNPEFASRRGRRGRGRRGRTTNASANAPAEEEEAEPAISDEEAAAMFAVEPDGAAEEVAEDDESGELPLAEVPAPVAAPPPPPVSRPPAQRDRDPRPVRDQRPSGRPPGITDLLREGQEILVQIAKEPIGLKGARITSYVALPGRYLVYMPTVNHVGVSRKIPSEQERTRLKRTMHTLCEREQIPGGFIVRTACEGHTDEELLEDMLYLYRTWQDMRRRTEHAKPGSVIYRELDLVQRQLRDHMSSDFSVIRVDNEEEYARVVDFISRFQPKLVNRVKLYTRKRPIFEEFGVQPEIDAAIRPRVWLKSGGFIVINQTEALVAIDVNTGRFVGKSNRLEDTIVRTNLEAAVEIVRQIRLRDLGGIIVLDFIDMEERRNRQKVMQVLEQELKSDRSPSKILQFNDFGLVAITRKRVRQSLEKTLCEPCSYCSGSGLVKSTQTMCYEILAEAKKMAIDWELKRVAEVTLRVNPEVAKALRGDERQVFLEIEALVGCAVTVKADPAAHQEQFDFAVV
ncbi:MAG: Rne/Rng family ribonuclease [Blastocatellia bacterium]|nr:Rne/Rng family ribonuclease [Blastocatellia bacterium]